MPRLLHPEILVGRDRRRARDPPRDLAHLRLGYARAARVVTDRDRAERLAHGLEAIGPVSKELVIDQILLHEHGEQCGEHERVTAGTHLQVMIGHRGGLGPARIDHDQRARRIRGDLLEDHARAGETVRLPRVLADEHTDLGVLEVAAGVALRLAIELPVDPELPGLLLRERVRRVDRAERRTRRPPVRAAEVVPLPASAVIEDGVAAVGVAHGSELLRDLADRRVPIDLLERPIGAPPQR